MLSLMLFFSNFTCTTFSHSSPFTEYLTPSLCIDHHRLYPHSLTPTNQTLWSLQLTLNKQHTSTFYSVANLLQFFAAKNFKFYLKLIVVLYRGILCTLFPFKSCRRLGTTCFTFFAWGRLFFINFFCQEHASAYHPS